MKRLLSLCIIALTSTAISAQRAYDIYPVPQSLQLGSQTARITSRVALICESGIDDATRERARQVLEEHGHIVVPAQKALENQSNLIIGINGSRLVADREISRQKLSRSVFRQPKYDRHLLSLAADRNGVAQICILGEHTDAAFYALASLEQMLDEQGKEPTCALVEDYADVENRGIIEGYYGVPYSAAVTKDLFRFMMRLKMNTYMYGAKSDPYHSARWAEPYPESITPEQEAIGYLSQSQMRSITATAHATKVNFIWAIHPGQAFTDSAQTGVNAEIMRKFEAMHNLGVRQFGVFVDDVGVPEDARQLELGASRLTALQQLIDHRWNTPGATPADTVKPLHYVPQLYAYGWTTLEKGARFFQSLSSVPQKINIYITGRNIWSVPNNADLRRVSSWLGRDVAWWWNYPCNDQDVSKIFPADIYTNFRDERHIFSTSRLEPSLQGTRTLISNPMQQGEISKIALFSVADYAWNNRAFNAERSHRAALQHVGGAKYAEALQTVIPFLRYYDADANAYLTADYRRGAPDFPGLLQQQLEDVNRACHVLCQMETDSLESHRLFYADLRPWLLRLMDITAEATALMRSETAPETPQNPSRYEFPILEGMGSDIRLKTQTAEPAAEVLRPLIEKLRNKQ